MVKFLLEAGADHEHKTDEMHTALMEASMDGHVEVARLLLDHGAQVSQMVIESWDYKFYIEFPKTEFAFSKFQNLTGSFRDLFMSSSTEIGASVEVIHLSHAWFSQKILFPKYCICHSAKFKWCCSKNDLDTLGGQFQNSATFILLLLFWTFWLDFRSCKDGLWT